MKTHLPLLCILFGLVVLGTYFLSHPNKVNAQSCDTIDSGIAKPFFYTKTADICSDRTIDSGQANCSQVESRPKDAKNTGNDCCFRLGYDYCQGSIILGGLSKGDFSNQSYTWQCCFNPTPYPCIAAGGSCIASYPCNQGYDQSNLSCGKDVCCMPQTCSITSILSITCPESVQTGASFSIGYTFKDAGLNSIYKWEHTWLGRADIGYTGNCNIGQSNNNCGGVG